MDRTKLTTPRFMALDAVRQGKICYQNGLLRPALGYAWAGVARPMTDVLRQALRELWVADFIDIHTDNLFAPLGHRVVITAKGEQVFRHWSTVAGRASAA